MSQHDRTNPTDAEITDLPVVSLDGEQPGGTSRRAFLTGAAGLTGVALASGAWRAPAFATPTAGAPVAAASAGGGGGGGVAIDLTLDGLPDGTVPVSHSSPSTFEASIEAEVGPEDEPGTEGASRKRPGRVKYGDITLRTGTGMSKHFYNWVKDSFDGKPNARRGSVAYGRKSGSVIACDFDRAFVSEIGLPALDAASKDAAKMTIKLSPTTSDFRRASSMAAPLNAKEQKKWLPSNFRLSLGDLPCSRVNKIEAITIKQAFVEKEGSDGRISTKEPTKLEFPNLSISFPEDDMDPWDKWFEDFVIAGNNTDKSERAGQLIYLAADNTPLFLLDFTGVGIFKLTPDKVEAGSDQIRRVKAEMYVERIGFKHNIKF